MNVATNRHGLEFDEAHALHVTGANAARGPELQSGLLRLDDGAWLRPHAEIVRFVAIEPHENIQAIEAWRATLSERDRRRLVHPPSNVRRWRASLDHGNGKTPDDLKREAG